MSDKTWKQVERKICKSLGGERTPLSGFSSRHTHGDCINVPEYVEIKHREKIVFLKAFKESEEKAKKEGKPLLFIIKEKHQHGAITFMTLERYLDITGRNMKVIPIFAEYEKCSDSNHNIEECVCNCHKV